MDPILVLLGVLIGICTALQGVGTFTNAWITTINPINKVFHLSNGIVPIRADDPGYIQAAGSMMCLSFVLCFFVAVYYIVLMIKVSRFGYLTQYRRFLVVMIIETVCIIALTTTSVILVGTNIKKYGLSLGYSAWMCVGSSAIQLVGVIGICIYRLKKFDQPYRGPLGV